MNIGKKTLLLLSSAVIALAYPLTSLADTVAVSKKAENMPPIAEASELTTYRGVRVSGTLSAVDPDGDAVTFEIKTLPQKGSLELRDSGRFIYRPFDGKSGRDSFTFIATDSNGAESAEGTVSITIRKITTDVCYSDIDTCDSCYEIMRLTEEGIFTGDSLGESCFFRPDMPVTRGEFLTMCMKAADVKPINGLSKTSFADDDDMAGWVKPYVATALMHGYISGYADESGQVFSADDEITSAQAAVMLKNILGITDAVSVAVWDEESDCPVWAYGSVCSLRECGIDIRDAQSTEPVTRLEAASMLSSAMDVLASRSTGLFR